MKITIIGAGNIGTAMAVEMAAKGHSVVMYSSKPDLWSKTICEYDVEDNLLASGEIAKATSDLKEAVSDAEMIVITVPSFMFGSLGQELESLVNPSQIIGVVPGSGGAEFAFAGLIQKGCTFFGLQRVHCIARLKEYGRSVHMLGKKNNLYVGTIPSDRSQLITGLLESLFDIPCVATKNYLAVTLTPSNPILHTSRLYSLFHDYHEGITYPHNYLFYGEWTDEASDLLIRCDSEEQQLCDAIPLDLSDVVSLQKYYESPTDKAMTAKIRSIKAFDGLNSPMIKVHEGWIPDWSSRYFIADFPFGLKIIKDIARLFDVSTPSIDLIWDWYASNCPENAANAFQLNMGKQELISHYK